ncbi:MAG: hypothetical protein F9K42_10025, partial [Ignavibacterium sp.]
MQKSLIVLILFVLSIASFAQVEEAVRYRVQGEATLIEQQVTISNSSESADKMVFQNRSNSQLDELGARYVFVRSGSQLDELGARYVFVRSGSQLDELGARYVFVRSGS